MQQGDIRGEDKTKTGKKKAISITLCLYISLMLKG